MLTDGRTDGLPLNCMPSPPIVGRGIIKRVRTPSLTGALTATDMYEVPDVVPPVHAVSSHVATDKDPYK